jgi:hypothetical protein
MRKNISIIFVLAAFALSACQNNAALPQNNQGNTVTQKPAEEIVPVLKTSAGDFKLRSQTARYTGRDQTAIEIILSNTSSAFCQKQHPTLLDSDEQIKVTATAKDGKTRLSKGELVNNPQVDVKLSKITKNGELNLDPKLINSLNLTDLNASIVRGNLKTTASTDGKIESLEGEIFAAICK